MDQPASYHQQTKAVRNNTRVQQYKVLLSSASFTWACRSSLSENNAVATGQLTTLPGVITPATEVNRADQTAAGIPLIAIADARPTEMRNTVVSDAGITSIENILYPTLSDVNTGEGYYRPRERIPFSMKPVSGLSI